MPADPAFGDAPTRILVPVQTADAEPFRFRVTAVFTINGRGLVAAGIAETGMLPRKGDRVFVLHGATTTEVTCEAVEGMRVRPAADPATVGLLLPERSPDDLEVGDLITGW